MRTAFAQTASALVEEDPRAAVVLAEISADLFAKAAARHPDRVLNVGIRQSAIMERCAGQKRKTYAFLDCSRGRMRHRQRVEIHFEARYA